MTDHTVNVALVWIRNRWPAASKHFCMKIVNGEFNKITSFITSSTSMEQNANQFESKIYVKKMWRNDEGQDESMLIESSIPISCSAENFFVSTTTAIASEGNIM